jgi:hypothetical protein
MMNVNINATDLQKSVFEGFNVQPSASIENLDVREINAYVTVRIRTGKLTCYSTSSTSQVGKPSRRRRSGRVGFDRAKASITLKITDDARKSISIRPRRNRDAP